MSSFQTDANVRSWRILAVAPIAHRAAADQTSRTAEKGGLPTLTPTRHYASIAMTRAETFADLAAKRESGDRSLSLGGRRWVGRPGLQPHASALC